MQGGLLEGYCWQTTESAIVFLEEEDWIERGNLKIDSCQKYWHAWICFKFQNKIFVFDPCLQILVEKKIKYFQPNIINIIRKNKKNIIGGEDVNSPMYRNNTGYTATFESGKINSLIAHFYENY